MVPSQLSDLSLLRDVLEYILPAGTSYELSKLNFRIASADTIIGTGASARSKWLATQSELAQGVTDGFARAKIYDNEEAGYSMNGDVIGEIAG